MSNEKDELHKRIEKLLNPTGPYKPDSPPNYTPTPGSEKEQHVPYKEKKALSGEKIKKVLSTVEDPARLKKFQGKMHDLQLSGLDKSFKHHDAGDFAASGAATVRQRKMWQAKTDSMDRRGELKKKASALPTTTLLSFADELAKIAGDNRAANAIELGGLGVLAVPSLDGLQARARARLDGDKSKKGIEGRRLLPEGAHDAMEVAGLGTLAAPYVLGMH